MYIGVQDNTLIKAFFKIFLIMVTVPGIVKRGDRNLALSVREYGVPRDSSSMLPHRGTIRYI